MTTSTKTKAKVKPQIHMDDVVVDDTDLLEMLEERLEAKKAVSAYREIDKKVKTKISEMAQQPPYRIGRFYISKTTMPGRSVNFETQSSTRINIKLVGD